MGNILARLEPDLQLLILVGGGKNLGSRRAQL